MMINAKLRYAFSLVELSIVLVILGLLVGGVLSGQALIHAAELRAVTTEYNRWVTASRTFRDKYFALPGDMPNATAFWGTATCPGDSDDARTTQATCNGNGDGTVYHFAIPTLGTNEAFNLWQHLANAGLIEGTYSGVADNNSTSNVNVVRRGWNAPASKLGGTASWSVEAQGTITIASTTFIEGDYGNALTFGESSGGNGLYNPVISPADAWNIDTKLDDGKAGTGTIVAREHTTSCFLLSGGGAGSTSAAAARNDVIYNLTNTAATFTGCALVFKNAF